MKKKKRVILVLLSIIAVALVASVFIFGKKAEYIAEIDEKEVTKAFSLLNNSLRTKAVMYTEFLDNTLVDYGKETVEALPINGQKIDGYENHAITLNYNDFTTYHISVKEEGLYQLVLDYRPMENNLSNFIVDVEVNGEYTYSEMKNIILPLIWQDETKEFPKDRYQDETAPNQTRQDRWVSQALYNNSYYTAAPMLFHLKQGENVIKVTNVSSNGLGVGSLVVEAPQAELPTYEEYRKLHQGTLVKDLIEINSSAYVEKNTTQAIYSSENNPALTPNDNEFKKINVLTWEDPGTEVVYEREIEEEGYYNIAFHYRNSKSEFAVFNSIKIDGEVPFKELANYTFNPTRGKWKNEVLGNEDGTPFEVYLTKGTHTITIRSEQEPVVRAWRYARLIAEHVTQLESDITKITGSENDKNRTWQITRYIPEVADYLAAYETLLDYMRYSLQGYGTKGTNSAIFSDLDKASGFIRKMAKYPDEIALHRQNLTGKGSSVGNSILLSMANFTNALPKQNFSLDMIYLFGDEKLPKPNPNIFATISNNTKTLLHTFTSEKYKIENDKESLNIWVNRAVTHVDLLQKMADAEFTPKTGIKVKISIMPDANKLTLAAAAKETPDMALGMSSYMPFDLASRGALYDFTQFPDFWEVAGRFVPGSFVPYIYNGGMYAVPETLNFYSSIYRKDIFADLGLTPPDTWDDVKDMLPVLQRYGMNFYHNISTGEGYKWFYQTSPLIFQNQGHLYTSDGLRTAIDEPNSVKGIQALGDLFIAYALDRQVGSFFNSFRSGTLPIGIVDLDTYIQIKYGAPELDGQWELSPLPGTPDEAGDPQRWYIANGTGGIIFKDSEKVDDAWSFLKWWTDYETQVSYTYTLQSTYGRQFVWMPSNVEAVKASPFPQADKEVILSQVHWLRDVPRTPGQYLLERSISDIWNDMVLDGASAQVAIDQRVLSINREIKKKMKEIGFYDEAGNMIKSYVILDIDWVRQNIENARTTSNSQTRYTDNDNMGKGAK